MTIPFYQIHSNSNAPNYVDFERPKYWWVRLDTGPTLNTGQCPVIATCPDRQSGLSPWVPVQVNMCDRSYHIPTGGQRFTCCSHGDGNMCVVNLDYQGSVGPVSFTNMYRPCRPITDACGCTVTGIHDLHSYSTGSADHIVNYTTELYQVFQGTSTWDIFTAGVTRSPIVTLSLPTCQSCTNYWNSKVCNYSPIVYSPTTSTSFASQTVSTQCHCSNGYADICLRTRTGQFSVENAIDCACCNWGACCSRAAVVCHGEVNAKYCVKPCISGYGGCNHRYYHWIQNDDKNPDYFYHVMSFSARYRTETVCNCHCLGPWATGNCFVQNCCGGVFDNVVARVKICASGNHCVPQAIIFPVSCLQSDGFITRGTFKKLCNMEDDQFLLTTNGVSFDWEHSATCRCCSASTKLLSFDIATGCTCVIRMNIGCSCANNFCNTYTDAIFTSRGTFVVATSTLACANCYNSNEGFSTTYISEFNCDFTVNLGTVAIRPNVKRIFDCDCNTRSCTSDVVNLAYDKYDDSVIVSFGKSSNFSSVNCLCGLNATSSGAIHTMKLPSCIGSFCQYLCEQCRYSGPRCCLYFCCCCLPVTCTYQASCKILNTKDYVYNVCSSCVCAQRTVFTAPTMCSTGSFLNCCTNYRSFLQRLCWDSVCLCNYSQCLCNVGCAGANPSLFCRFRYTESQTRDICCGCASVFCKDYTRQYSPSISYTAFCVECN